MKGFIDPMNLTGEVRITLRGPDGRIKESDVQNLVVTTGKQHVADQLSGQLEASMSHMAVGTGTTAAALTDTSLETELNRRAFDSKTQGTGADANKVTFITAWPAGEGTGLLTEAAILNAAGGGVMLCRVVFGVKDKGAGDSITLTWTITVN